MCHAAQALKNRSARIVAVLSMVLCTTALTACTAPVKGVSVNALPDAQRVIELQKRANWSVSGGIGIWTDAENITASMQWQQQSNNLDVTLSAPLGLGIIRVVETAAGAQLQRGATRLNGPDASRLVQRALQLSVPVPLHELSAWMRGLPGTADEVAYDEKGRLAAIRYIDDAGVLWRANVRRYTQAADVSVPALITAKGGPYNVRLVLKRWNFSPIESDVLPSTNDSPKRLVIPDRSS